MHIDRHEITFNHHIGNVKIQPSHSIEPAVLLSLIKLALDSYVLGQNVPSSVIHAEIREQHKENYNTPGYYLYLFRSRANLSQAKLAENIGVEVKQHHISEMEQNKRAIGKNIAKKIAIVLECDYKKFL